jgi:hypothetical protein
MSPLKLNIYDILSQKIVGKDEKYSELNSTKTLISTYMK